MDRFLVLLCMASLTACASSRVLGEADDDVDAAGPDGGGGLDGAALDGGPPDGTPVAAGPTVLLSEVVLAPNERELIELVNPTGVAVDLSSYYLADAPDYWRLPAGVPTTDAADFIVRFPAGASLPPGGVITVALDTAAAFTTAYGVAPTYSIASGTMVRLTPGSLPTLTNAGEPVVLFRWDGQSDRVADVDLILAGIPTAANLLTDKSNVALDGPDADSTTTAYRPDARTMTAQPTAPGSGTSTKRLALESAATEVATGGNGLAGHDETSEATGTTWDASGYTAPTPGAVPATLAP